MQLAYFIIPFLSYLKHVTSSFQCIGTCYSGRLFPLPEDIVYGKHLNGYSYRNITTDDAKKCYSSCVNDCHCKACQTKDARCELLDEDHTSKPSDFVAALGYVYYDLKQGFYKGLKSHMVPPGVCHNGCCQFQTCMNGGTCIEYCDTPKVKFHCKCPQHFIGKLCEKEARSCLDYLKEAPFGTTPPSGKYIIWINNRARNVFCDFIGPSQAWTLIESFSRKNTAFKTKAFHQIAAKNFLTPNWEDYRTGLPLMKYMRKRSTMFRATCDFPNRGGVLTPDYLFGYLSDYDIINRGDVKNTCFKFAHMNVRGYDYFNVNVKVWHNKDRWHFHINCPSKCPGFAGVPKSVSNEDCFGYYDNYNRDSKCTATPQSTTQWWLGEQKYNNQTGH